MKKGQIYEGYVERLDFPNKGIVKCEDETAVVKNTIPGQKISFMVTKKRKGKAEGRCIEVLEKAPYEQESACPHFGECGGCNYQNLPQDEYIAGSICHTLLEVCYLERFLLLLLH